MKDFINEPGDWDGSAHSVKEEAPGVEVNLPDRADLGFLGPREFQKRRAAKRVYRGPLH